jgi:regulator of sigma E protease
MFLTIVVFLIVLSVLVLVHEAGHFIVAKLLKIKVEEFGVGLPPRAFGVKYGETLYSINWLPIGGFVKLYGEDEAGSGRVKLDLPQATSQKSKVKSKDLERAFFARPVWQRAIVVVAGVFMNFLLAVVIISFLFSWVGVPLPTNKVLVTFVVDGSPAQKAGLKVGDQIVSVNGRPVSFPQEVIDATKANLGKSIRIKVLDKGQAKDLNITPRKVYPANQGPMGVAISEDIKIVKYPWYQAPFVGTKEALKESLLIVLGLASLLIGLVSKGIIPTDVAGPVGIAQLTGQVVNIGPYAVLSFISLLSLNLAIINILPIPALDGGRLFFILFEAVTRRKVNPKIESYAHTIGMAVLLALVALITIHDLFRVFTGQPILPK